MTKTFRGKPNKQALADIAALKEQLRPLSPLALQALRLGLQERRPECIKMWFAYTLAIQQLELQDESPADQGPMMKISDDLYVAI